MSLDSLRLFGALPPGGAAAAPAPDLTPNATPAERTAPDRLGAPLVDMRPDHRGLPIPMTQERRDRARLRSASWAFTTRRVPPGVACAVLPPLGKPQAGDLVLARIDALGHHAALQLVNGRRRQLFVGDEVVVAYGNRYASNQFEAVVPESLGPCQLVAGGGIAARARSWHAKITRGPTEITPIGLLADACGKALNLRDFAVAPATLPHHGLPTPIVVVGTSMDSGKTTTCVQLVRGLLAAGLRAGYAKVTGTGAGGDYWLLRDAGADPVLDFTDAGHASTYLLSPDEVERTMSSLVAQLARQGVDAMVLEVADGVLQRETAALLDSAVFARLAGGVVLAAQDAMGAVAGWQFLRERQTPVLAMSGLLTTSPLQIEEARGATNTPIHDRDGLATASVAAGILARARGHLDARRGSGAGAA